MGLDMYAYAVDDELVESNFGFKPEESGVQRLHYWRKHHDLHGWMKDLWRSKLEKYPDNEEFQNLAGYDFNCRPVRLTLEDLDDLELAVKNRSLPRTTGFFFGDSPQDDRSVSDDLQFISKARIEIDRGKAVFYDSWW